MPLIPYDPFRLIKQDGSRFPRIFDSDWFETHFSGMARVPVDVHETQTEVVVTAEIPGLEKREDVNITVHDGHLHLNGKIERTSEQKDENMHRTERYYGQFSRTIPLPTEVSETGAKASYKSGILEIRLPKSQAQIGRQIDVDFH
ncbi:Hsp20/alpha crystallin family protein [Alicyclobacillus fastidiosus]|uniref:Hsp20/alpha crystallin family protein n=2 Tax=Alicyclobacillus fastidiosus TaxID=392011 RepID=A0ABY6ZGK7_9BACL|nr:Hsp20/alpha crystallin family protein [Alicyclobacillus fastidiosus]WAH42030.1 Hsp20/alpha crystallin family protein [Alicyclobacillus fastidiosus]GMA63782.1 heat-shock protein Hsp20 [Alicyclobacillus fastidiosus]